MSGDEWKKPGFVPAWADPDKRCDYVRPYAGLCDNYAKRNGTRCPQHEGVPQRDPGRNCKAEGCNHVAIQDKPFCPRHDPEIKAAWLRERKQKERHWKRIEKAEETSSRAFQDAVRDLSRRGILPKDMDLLVQEGRLRNVDLCTIFLVPLAAALHRREPGSRGRQRRS